MNILKPDLDVQISQLEAEWRQAYESSIAARVDYQTLTAHAPADVEFLDMARERLERAEALKTQVVIQIERLEAEILGNE